MMTLLALFWSFVKIGFTSFGGLSMIPLISSEMISHGWMTAEEVSDIVAIAEMTPGPVGMNCATFAGLRTAGIPGAVMSNLGILMPTFTLCLAAAVFFEKFKNAKRMTQIMIGVRPACLGLLVGVAISLALTNYIGDGGRLNLPALIIGAADLFLMLKVKAGVPLVILLSAAAGVVCFGVLGL